MPDLREQGILGALSRAQQRRDLTSSRLVELALHRIAASADLNAVVCIDADAARAAAHDIDRKRTRGDTLGMLAGVPVLVKDNMDVAGLPTTHGSKLHAGAGPALTDDRQVARLRAADAVIVGKTNLSEFAMEAISDNLVFGATHNPWRRGISPGGSSGGSAAALAAGLIPVATGTDGGGSVRIPAALCGLLGLKPTSGVVGARPARLPVELSCAGPMASTVADLRLLAQLGAGPAYGDPSCVYGPDPGWTTRPLGKVFATTRVAGQQPVAADVEDVFTSAVGDFARAVDRQAHWLPPGVLPAAADEIWATIYAAEDVYSVGSDLLRTGRRLLDTRVLAWVDQGLGVTLEEYLAARQARNDCVLVLDQLLAEGNLLLTPTVTAAPYPVGGSTGDTGGLMPIDLFNTAAMNLTGHPALNVPAGYVDGVPFGLQVVGPRGSDLWLIALAEVWERYRPWPLVAPGYEPFLPSC